MDCFHRIQTVKKLRGRKSPPFSSIQTILLECLRARNHLKDVAGIWLTTPPSPLLTLGCRDIRAKVSGGPRTAAPTRSLVPHY